MTHKDAEYFFTTLPGKIICSKRFVDKSSGKNMRIASQIIETPEVVKFTTDLSVVEIRETPSGRQQVKASFFEDDRNIQTLTIQRYNKVGDTIWPTKRDHFSFVGEEIATLKKFLASIESADFATGEKSQLKDQDLNDIILGKVQARKLIANNAEMFSALLENESWEQDLVAVGFRRKQLEIFHNLLNDPEFFEQMLGKTKAGPEAVWQQFFEKNKWIFGYGLSYQFLNALDDRRLEQVVRGFALDGAGKRTDALMKTRGALGALCFVEIKRHDTTLLKRTPYRPQTWSPDNDLVGGVAQLQATTRAAIRQFGDNLRVTDSEGDPTGELLGIVSPKTFLVVGRLSEFETPEGPNLEKFACFEDFRKSLHGIEVITFDELYERAYFIVEQAG